MVNTGVKPIGFSGCIWQSKQKLRYTFFYSLIRFTVFFLNSCDRQVQNIVANYTNLFDRDL